MALPTDITKETSVVYLRGKDMIAHLFNINSDAYANGELGFRQQ